MTRPVEQEVILHAAEFAGLQHEPFNSRYPLDGEIVSPACQFAQRRHLITTDGRLREKDQIVTHGRHCRTRHVPTTRPGFRDQDQGNQGPRPLLRRTPLIDQGTAVQPRAYPAGKQTQTPGPSEVEREPLDLQDLNR